MLVVALNGSPHKDGNTVQLLEEALGAARENRAETALLHCVDALEGVDVPFCNLCSTNCAGRCSKDNSLGAAYDVLRKADAVLVGTPVHFGTVSAQLKSFWDKSRILRKEKSLLNTVGGVVTVGTGRFGGQETALNAAVQMMLVQGMTIVGDGHEDYDCGHFGSCAQKPTSEEKWGLERARILMLRMLEVAEATRNLRRGE